MPRATAQNLHRRVPLLRVVGGAAALSTVLALGASCSSSNKPASSQSPHEVSPATITASYVKTLAEKSAKIETTRSQSGPDPQAQKIGGSIDLRSKDLQGTLTAQGQNLQANVVDGTLYEKLPDQARTALKAKPWLVLSKGDLATLGQAAGGLTGSNQFDLSAPLRLLQGATAATTAGTKTLHDEKTKGYDVTISLDALAKADPTQAKTAAAQKKALGSDTMKAKVYLDGDGRVREFSFSQQAPAAAPAGGQSAAPDTATQTVDLYDFGTAVKPTAPPKDQRIGFADYRKKLEALAAKQGGPGSVPGAKPSAKPGAKPSK